MKNNAVRALLACGLTVASGKPFALDWEIGGRYRAQQVNDNRLGDAFASTLKLRLSANHQFDDSVSVRGSVDHVHAFNDGHYNDIVTPKSTSPIADPAVTMLSELSLQAHLPNDVTLNAGRLVLSHDNERHLGKEAYWQTRQTFDGAEFSYNDGYKFALSYTYVTQVNRYFSKRAKPFIPQTTSSQESAPIPRSDIELGVHQHNTHLLHGRYQLSRNESISGYFYYINNRTAQSVSSTTLGVRYANSIKPSKLKYDWVVEFAMQQDAANNPIDYRTYYALAEGKVQYKSHQFGATIEHVGKDNNKQFTTSLGSNHKFLGWADVFWGYGSFVDMNSVTLGYKGRNGKLRWKVNYHHFFTEDFDWHIGEEVDFELAYRYTRKWEAKIVLAHYFAQRGYTALPRTTQDLSTVFFAVSYNL